MLLTIDDLQKVDNIQDTFNECFSHLKIELFRNQRDFKNNSPVDGSYLLGDIRSIHDRGVLELKSWFSAEAVHQLFKKRYGMLVKIYKNENGKFILLKKNESLRNSSAANQKKINRQDRPPDDEEIRLDFPS